MKICIDIGHNCTCDSGAIGIIKEDDVVRVVSYKIIDLLKGKGHEVIVSDPRTATSLNDSLMQRVSVANDNNVQFFISIHANKTKGGFGTEAYSYPGNNTSYVLADRITQKIAALGYKNRGVKNGSELCVISCTDMPAVLVELFFVDSQDDVNRYDADKLALAVAEGIINETIITSPPMNQNDTRTVMLQKILNQLQITDYLGNRLDEDGVYGPCTTSAVKRFQDIFAINNNGIIDSLTWDYIYRLLDNPQQSRLSYNDIPTRYIQYRVGAVVDGWFGSETDRLVKKYQLEHGLTPDGIVGVMTWKKLLGERRL